MKDLHERYLRGASDLLQAIDQTDTDYLTTYRELEQAVARQLAEDG